MKKFEEVFKFFFWAVVGIAARMMMGSVASVLKTGTMAILISFEEMRTPFLQVPHCLQKWFLSFETLQFVLEGTILAAVLYGFELLMAFKISDANLQRKPEEFRRKSWQGIIMSLLLCTAGLEILSFVSSLLQFVGNGIWAAMTSSEASVTLRNRISWERWRNIDFLFRAWEGVLLTAYVVIRNHRVVSKRRREMKRQRRSSKDDAKYANRVLPLRATK